MATDLWDLWVISYVATGFIRITADVGSEKDYFHMNPGSTQATINCTCFVSPTRQPWTSHRQS